MQECEAFYGRAKGSGMRYKVAKLIPSILQPPSLATQLTPNGQDAYDIVRKKYYSGEFVLESGEVHHKQMNIMDNKGNTAEWIQF